MEADLSAANQQEQLRQQYLQALGVDCWLPRGQLPGAAPSRWEWQVAAESQPSTSPEQPQAAKPAVRANQAPLRQLLSGAAAEPVAAQQAAAAVEPAAEPLKPASHLPEPTEVLAEKAAEPVVESAVTVEPWPQFRLALIAFADCLVVTDLPLRSQQGLSAEHLQLLEAIVAALGRDSRLQGQREFQWPLDANASFDQSEPIARRALELELSRLDQNQQHTVLLMGQQAGRYLLPAGHQAEQGELVDHQGQQLLCCHGLNEVLRLPGLKAELWRQLQPVRLGVSGR